MIRHSVHLARSAAASGTLLLGVAVGCAAPGPRELTADELPVELRPLAGATALTAWENDALVVVEYRVEGVSDPLDVFATLQESFPERWKRKPTSALDFDDERQYPTSQVTGWETSARRDGPSDPRPSKSWSGAWQDQNGNALWYRANYDGEAAVLHVDATRWPSQDLRMMRAANWLYNLIHGDRKGNRTCDCAIRSGRIALRVVRDERSGGLEGEARLGTDTYFFNPREPFLGDPQICMLSRLHGGPEAFPDGHYTLELLLTPDGESRLARWTRENPGGMLGTFFDGVLVSVDRYDFELRGFAIVEGLDEVTAKRIATELETCRAFDVKDGRPCRWLPGEMPSAPVPGASAP